MENGVEMTSVHVTTTSSEEVKDVLANAVEVLDGSVEYADVLYETVEGVAIKKDKVEERVTTPAAMQGVVLRAYNSGKWREISVGGFARGKIIEAARKLAAFQPQSTDALTLDELKPWTIDEKIGVKLAPSEVELEEKLAHVRRLFAAAMGVSNKITNTTIGYSDRTLERTFANTEGSLLRQVIPRVSFGLVPLAKESGKMDYDYLSRGGTVGCELLDSLDEKTVRETAQNSIDLLSAAPPPSGYLTVILDPSITGIFSHESFGHGCEADQIIRKRSYLTPFVGKRIGRSRLNICDDGTLPGGNGSFLFDDEGVKSRKTYLLKDGVLQGFIHERYSASLMNVKPTGNGRRESFMRKLFVRMTNTYVEPGDYSVDAMIEDVDKGVVVVRGVSGMEDPLAGGMEIKAKKGYLVEHGNVSDICSTLTLTANVLPFLSSIDAVGRKDQFETKRGTCGKGHEDLIPVADGGVYLRAKAVVSQG
jgi:TldD protein